MLLVSEWSLKSPLADSLFHKFGFFVDCLRINASFNCAGEVLSPCRSVMPWHIIGSSALEEMAVFDFLSTPHVCYFRSWHSRVGWGETAVVDTGRRALCSQHSLVGVQESCRRLKSVLPQKLYHVVIVSLFLTVFLRHTRIKTVCCIPSQFCSVC